MFDPSDYQNVNGASSGVSNFLGSSGGQAGAAGAAKSNWLGQAGSWLNSNSMGQGMGMGGMNNGQMILAADQMGGQMFGMLAGKNQSVAGNIMKNIPGLSTIGNLWNAAFGSYINEEFVNQTNQGINSMRSRTFASNTNADVLNDWKNMVSMSRVNKDDVGSDGWFSSEAEDTTNDLNNNIDKANQLALLNFGHAVRNADANTDLRIAQGMQAAYGGPINSFRKYYSKGGYLSQAKALIRQNEGWSAKPYADSPKGKQWRSVGYGFNDSGFRDKYPEGISKHYEHGITKEQAEKELDYFLNKAEKNLKGIYGRQWDNFTDNEKAAILDTYYQRPASVGKGSRFYKAVTAGEDAGRYLGVAGYDKRNRVRRGVFGGSQDYAGYGNWESANPSQSSSLQEATILPVVQELDLSEITPTQARALQLNLSSPTYNLSMSDYQTPQPQQAVPAIGTVEDYLNAYDNMYAKGGHLFGNGGGWMDFFSSWSSANGGNNYFSNMGGSQWGPSDGLQVNSNNGNFGDWMGQAMTTFNTLSNWGKKDPTLGRGGGYSQFGMAAYDIAKTIRDASKSKRPSISEKLGIPIFKNGGNLFDEGGGIGAMGYADIANSALKLASNAVAQTKLDVDEDAVSRSIDRYGMSLDDRIGQVNTNGDLLDLWNNATWMQGKLSERDFRDKSLFDDFLDSYAASWEGFNAGQNFGPWGAAIGAIVGGTSSVVGSIIGKNKASNAAEDANEREEKANERITANLLSAADRVDRENDLRILQNMDNQGASGGKLSMGFGLRNPFVMPDGIANPLYRAFGGGITHGSNWDTGVNWVDEGGSHGENPLGGVPMGVDEQGVPNLVEEGEAIWNGDYVFSKRLKVPKKLAEKYKLGGDLTFADAVARLTKESEERPLDNISRATQDHILGEFADSQEEIRKAKAQRAMEKEQQLRDDFLTGFQFGLGGSMSPDGIIPNADNTSLFDVAERLFADGGGIHIDPSKKGTFKAQASKMGMGVQEAASHILANKEDYSPAMVKKANFAKNFAHAFGGSLYENPFAEGGSLGNLFLNGGEVRKLQDNLRSQGLTDKQIDDWIMNNKTDWDRGEYIRKYRLDNSSYGRELSSTPKNTASSRVENNGGSNSSSATQTKNSGTGSTGTAKKSATGRTSGTTTNTRGATGLNMYDWYRNGSDGIGEPTGFKVGKNGKAYDYTDEYKNLVKSLGADDIRQWAAEHPNDPSLRSFLAKGNKLEDLTDDQWRTGATDGKYGFMHHVADSMLRGNDEFTEVEEPAQTRSVEPEQPEAAWDFGDHSTDDTVPVRNRFTPRQTWMRQVPIWMSGLAALRGELTPPDLSTANAITNAAYQLGQPVSIGTEYVGDYRKRDPFDERYLMNLYNQRGAATNQNMMNFSGGNRAVGMSGILANDLTTQMAMAEAARQNYLANRADDAQVSDFNYRTNKGNADAQNMRNRTLAQLNSGRQSAMLNGIAQGARVAQAIKDQRDAAISANWTNFAQGMGDWGKENGFYNMLGGLNDEGVLKYFYGNDWKTMFNNTQQNG